MKIVHVVLGKANPERANGVNRVAHGLATAQVGAGADVEVWGITPTPAADTPARAYRFRPFQARRLRWTLDGELEDALRRIDARAVFHVHGGYHPEFHALARRLRRRGLPWVFAPHGALHPEVVGGGLSRKRAYVALFDSLLLCEAHAVHVFAPAEVAAVRRFAPGARVVCLPNGIDGAEFAVLARAPARRAPARRDPLQQAPARAPGADRPPRFGFCGRLDAHGKGLDVLVEAFGLHAARGGRGQLVLLGDGPDRARLEARARSLGIADRVEFAGLLLGPLQRERLAAYDVFVHPSRHEGMPIAVLEAAASGVPAVLTRATNLADAFASPQTGWVLEQHDAGALASILAECEAAVVSGEARQRGDRARELALGEHDWTVLAARSLRELYAERAAAHACASAAP